MRAMLELFCRERHAPSDQLCDECQSLLEYVEKRLLHCPFGAEKPACKDCTVHCYAPKMRERIREVMRTAGPKMPLHHPILALYHLLPGGRPLRRGGAP